MPASLFSRFAGAGRSVPGWVADRMQIRARRASAWHGLRSDGAGALAPDYLAAKGLRDHFRFAQNPEFQPEDRASGTRENRKALGSIC